MATSARCRVLAVLAVAALVGPVACSGGGTGANGAGRAGSSGDGGPGTDASEPEVFAGAVADFYVPPDPLPPGRRGDLVRVQPIPVGAGQAGLRIMYRSVDGEGDDRVVTGVVYHPTGDPPDGGWPVVASAHGTTGMAPACAPSRVPLEPDAFGVEGVRVATDYIGLGPEGELHPYLSAAAEGNAVVDAVRAVDHIDAAGAGRRWVVVGHSQGGHAALVTNEIGADALPDHDLLGTVAIAPAAQFTEVYGDEVQVRIVTAMALLGAAAEDPRIDPARYLDPAVAAAAETAVHDGCNAAVTSAMVPLAVAPDFYVRDPRHDDVARAWMRDNDAGRVASESPLLLVTGGRDALVVPARSRALYDRLCGLGQVVELVDLPGATHDTEPAEGRARISAWLADRLAGRPAAETCG